MSLKSSHKIGQTFDALSAVNTSIPDLTLTCAYLYRIDRVNGPDLPSPYNAAAAATSQANYFKSGSNIMDGVYTGVPGLRLEGYGFLLNPSAPGYAALPAQPTATAKLSTQTYGLRADCSLALADRVGGKLTGEFANQTNYAFNPLSFNLDYYLAEASVTYQGTKALPGYEVLEGRHDRFFPAAGHLAHLQWLGRHVPDHADQRSQGPLFSGRLFAARRRDRDEELHPITHLSQLCHRPSLLCSQTLTHLKLEFAASSTGDGPDAVPASARSGTPKANWWPMPTSRCLPNMPTIRVPAAPSAASPTNPSSGSRQLGNIENLPFVCFGRGPSSRRLTS